MKIKLPLIVALGATLLHGACTNTSTSTSRTNNKPVQTTDQPTALNKVKKTIPISQNKKTLSPNIYTLDYINNGGSMLHAKTCIEGIFLERLREHGVPEKEIDKILPYIQQQYYDVYDVFYNPEQNEQFMNKINSQLNNGELVYINASISVNINGTKDVFKASQIVDLIMNSEFKKTLTNKEILFLKNARTKQDYKFTNVPNKTSLKEIFRIITFNIHTSVLKSSNPQERYNNLQDGDKMLCDTGIALDGIERITLNNDGTRNENVTFITIAGNTPSEDLNNPRFNFFNLARGVIAVGGNPATAYTTNSLVDGFDISKAIYNNQVLNGTSISVPGELADQYADRHGYDLNSKHTLIKFIDGWNGVEQIPLHK